MAVTGQPHKPKDWSELPKDLVVMIGERFGLYADYVRFRSVCVSWYSALSTDVLNHHPSPTQSRLRQYFPFLLLPYCFLEHGDRDSDEEKEEEEEEEVPGTCRRGLLSVAENGKVYYLRGLPIREFSSMHCPGSSHGWLVVVDMGTPSVKLINPFTRAQLPLPPMNTFRDIVDYKPNYEVGEEYTLRRYDEQRRRGLMSYLTVQKVVLSTSPPSPQIQSSDDVVAVAIFGGVESGSIESGSVLTAFSRPGDKSWTRLPKAIFLDILFYKDHLYAVRSNGNGVSVDIEILVIHMDMENGGGGGCSLLVPKLVDTLKPPKRYRNSSKWRPYLVESCGDLLLVARVVERRVIEVPPPAFGPWSRREVVDKTIRFRIFKLCRHENTSDNNKFSSSSYWVRMNNLGDRMLFLGVNSSFSLSAHDFPGCGGNCIYFTHHHTEKDHYYKKESSGYDIDAFDMGVFNLEDKRIEPLPLERCRKRGIKDDLDVLYPPPIWLIPNSN